MTPDWQPIATAPLDEDGDSPWLLLYEPPRPNEVENGVYVGRTAGGVWIGCRSGLQGWYLAGQSHDIGDLKPSHWAPLPEPPVEPGADL